MTKYINEFRLCIDEERFYDAHEILEELWFPRRFETSNEVMYLKGLINVAVSFELMKRGREKQSKKVWMNYLKYRQLFFKIDSLYLNEFYKLSRHLENIYFSKTITTLKNIK